MEIQEQETLMQALRFSATHVAAALSNTLADLQTQVHDITNAFYTKVQETTIEKTSSLQAVFQDKTLAIQLRADDATKSIAQRISEILDRVPIKWTDTKREQYMETAMDFFEKVEETKVVIQQTLEEGKLQLRLHYEAAMGIHHTVG
ncbi:hypothetical protein THRCLA_05205 [Thraustotheca clavata]|uniref:Uncharacterized protein n=1 Tax=Thraustotheca clavata TaxID=74557 RepID=A0A1V9ZXA0_9STRA|nr:hypothetical protein THRCLA_05205 [Thraustotheca clavata]